MNLFRKRKSEKQTNSEQLRVERMNKLATSPNMVKYTSLYENGVMHIVEHEYSRMLELGELDYRVADEEEQTTIVASYADALNTLDKDSRYQLLILNQRIDTGVLKNILLPLQEDGRDIYRKEINQLVEKHFVEDQKNFEMKKYAIFTTKANHPKKANEYLHTITQNFSKKISGMGVELEMTPLGGAERLKVFAQLLRPKRPFSMKYSDLTLTGKTTRHFIAPNRIKFFEDYFKLDEYFGRVLYIRDYPKYLEDVLIRDLCNSEHELAISIHAKPYDMNDYKKMLRSKSLLNKSGIANAQKQAFEAGLIPEDNVSGLFGEMQQTMDELKKELSDNGQKVFSGIFSVFLLEESKEALEEATTQIQNITRNLSVSFESVYKMQEEAINTILPIGKPYLDVETNYMRDMVTTNIATQVPFSSVELEDPTGQYLGQNQLSKNIITVNRKHLNTPSGLIFGSSGSGKGMTTKWSILSTLLSQKEDRFIIVDPESEYLPIGRAFGAEILDIYPGSIHHLNILDMVDQSLLDQEDKYVDLVKEKSNLLSTLFESLLKEYSDTEASIVDRVTRLTYEQHEKPTLVDWYHVLLEQVEEEAHVLATKVETYTTGSQDIFAHETNIDLGSKFVIFNIKRLDERLKPFAMKVILDQIWNQVVQNQGKVTTWLFFDELQLNFDTEANASWFMKLWSRVRKYGAIPTGITQNVSTLLENTSGQRMISNSEFIVLLRQKQVDLMHLKKVMTIPDSLLAFVGERVPKGTGLISAGGVVVPFENVIPKDTEIFALMNTDAG